jgi:hypothetical protein
MTQAQINGLVDDQGTPIRWKAATIISSTALALTLVISIAKAGAKAEKLDNLGAKVEKLEALAPKVERLDAWRESVDRRLSEIEASGKETRLDVREILREVRRR